ncbi:response regulator [Danxiaibacter flavus]|uniref:Response regulator n=1 Tax=Danxiaibacter flavus TaxID=3049108 RepID=A0ABV3ZKV1_9BACT|nr:response regulator [Chitinophagaceae bacterium DXS]
MRKRVAIFDDDPDILEVCAIILKSKGFDIITQTNCIDILQKVKTFQPDVILMDNWIPDIGGIKATQLIKADKETKHIPVIFFSANNNIENLAREATADHFLQKPFDISTLHEMVSNALQESTALVEQK